MASNAGAATSSAAPATRGSSSGSSLTSSSSRSPGPLLPPLAALPPAHPASSSRQRTTAAPPPRRSRRVPGCAASSSPLPIPAVGDGPVPARTALWCCPCRRRCAGRWPGGSPSADLGVPAAVFVPTGYGELLFGIGMGFAELRRLEVTDRVPRLIACEPAAGEPLAAALRQGLPAAHVEVGANDAYGISCPVNGYRGVLAVRGSGAARSWSRTSNCTPPKPSWAAPVCGPSSRRRPAWRGCGPASTRTSRAGGVRVRLQRVQGSGRRPEPQRARCAGVVGRAGPPAGGRAR